MEGSVRGTSGGAVGPGGFEANFYPLIGMLGISTCRNLSVSVNGKCKLEV